MAQWDFASSLVGGGDKMVSLVAGSGGWAKGDPLIANGSGAFVRPTAATSVPRYVAQSTTVSGSVGVAVPALPTNVFRVTMSGAGVVGGQYDLTVTTLTINTSGTTTKAVEVIGIDEATTTIAYVVSRGWASTL